MSTPDTAFTPWSITFDLHDQAHCGWRAAHAADLLPDDVDDTVVDELADCFDLEHAARVLSELAEGRDDDQLDEALVMLRGCDTSCQCGLDAWEAERDWVDQQLADLDVDAWQFTVHDRTEHDDGDLTVSTLFDRMPWHRSGWSSVHIEVTADRLAATFAGYPCPRTTVVARPLRGPHAELYQRAGDFCDLPADLPDIPAVQAQAALDLHVLLDAETSALVDIDEILAFVRAHDVDDLTQEQLETIVVLAQDWSGDTVDLLAAAATLVPA